MTYIGIYRDDFGNAADIDYSVAHAYKGGPMTDHYRLTCRAVYDNNYVYHVSVHETQADAENELRKMSCGTFRRIK